MIEATNPTSAEVLTFNFCDYNDADILVRGNVTAVAPSITEVAFKTCTLFTKCVSKIDGTTIDDAENLDLNVLM